MLAKRLVSFLENTFTFCEGQAARGAYARLLHPGDEAATEPGRRRINWVWYIGAGELELARDLTDKEVLASCFAGPGLASGALIDEICDLADGELHPKVRAELVATTADPFVQTIVDGSPFAEKNARPCEYKRDDLPLQGPCCARARANDPST